MNPTEIAYLVGGPADGQEHEVSRVGGHPLYWAEAVPVGDYLRSPSTLVPALRIHVYAPCHETGEWLWQGVR